MTVLAVCSIVVVLLVVVTQTFGGPRGAGGSVSAGEPAATAPAGDGATGDEPDVDSSDGPPQAPGDQPSPGASPPTSQAPVPGTSPGVQPPAAPHPQPPAHPQGPPSAPARYEAESGANTLAGARVVGCAGCSGANKVGDVGRGAGTLTFNGITASADGAATVTITYVNGGGTTRSAQLSVDGGAPVPVRFPATRDWNTTGTVTVDVTLKSGGNTLRFANPNGPAPDFDLVVVGGVGQRAPSMAVV